MAVVSWVREMRFSRIFFFFFLRKDTKVEVFANCFEKFSIGFLRSKADSQIFLWFFYALCVLLSLLLKNFFFLLSMVVSVNIFWVILGKALI